MAFFTHLNNNSSNNDSSQKAVTRFRESLEKHRGGTRNNPLPLFSQLNSKPNESQATTLNNSSTETRASNPATPPQFASPSAQSINGTNRVITNSSTNSHLNPKHHVNIHNTFSKKATDLISTNFLSNTSSKLGDKLNSSNNSKFSTVYSNQHHQFYSNNLSNGRIAQSPSRIAQSPSRIALTSQEAINPNYATHIRNNSKFPLPSGRELNNIKNDYQSSHQYDRKNIHTPENSNRNISNYISKDSNPLEHSNQKENSTSLTTNGTSDNSNFTGLIKNEKLNDHTTPPPNLQNHQQVANLLSKGHQKNNNTTNNNLIFSKFDKFQNDFFRANENHFNANLNYMRQLNNDVSFKTPLSIHNNKHTTPKNNFAFHNQLLPVDDPQINGFETKSNRTDSRFLHLKGKSKKYENDHIKKSFNTHNYNYNKDQYHHHYISSQHWVPLFPLVSTLLYDGINLSHVNLNTYIPQELSAFETLSSHDRILGQGAYGVVIKARYMDVKKRISSDNLVAIKIISNHHFICRGLGAQLKREINCHLKCRHPNILPCYACFETKDNSFLILECMKQTLQAQVAQVARLPETKICHYIGQLMSAVAYLHERKIIHRDIKLDNILWNPDNIIKLSDFGWCAETHIQYPNEVSGSFPYMAPEILLGNPQTSKVDIWSVGCCAYELFTGTPLFSLPQPVRNRPQSNEWSITEMMKQHKKNYIERLKSHLSYKFASFGAIDFIVHCLAYNPKYRLNAHSALTHSWLKAFTLSTPSTSPDTSFDSNIRINSPFSVETDL